MNQEFAKKLFPDLKLNFAAEMFDRTPTTGIVIFEVLIILTTAITLFMLYKKGISKSVGEARFPYYP